MITQIFLKDYVPPSLNTLFAMNHFARSKYKDAAGWVVKKYFKGIHFEKLKSLSYVFYFKDKRKRDNDNYCAKYLTDALRYQGVIPEDSSDITGPTMLYIEFNNPEKIQGTKIIMEV